MKLVATNHPWLAVLCAAGQLSAASAATPEEGVAFFEKRIRPVLAEHCYECHSASAK
ncbi:MAG: hypothetical protein HY300_15300, partial [Verrucomicrobia bacterium]|nr:hypothetical protein [Verrucomicrobiota bacterium]